MKIDLGTFVQADIDAFLTQVQTDTDFFNEHKIYLDKDFSQTNRKATKARATFLFYSPIEIDGKRYKTYKDDEEGQDDKFLDFTEKIKKEVEEMESELNQKLFNFAFFDSELNKLIMSDFGLAIVSFTFVLIYVSFHIKSIFLAVLAMLAIGFSYPIAIFFNRFIFQVDFFQSLNFIAVFVILGISADNIFVFTDTWQQTLQYDLLNPDSENKYNNFQTRMNHTWRKATKAISTTSFTTAMAFLATGFSKIMPISAFGYFACILVIINYLFAIVTYPACLILFERYLAHRCRYRQK